MESYKPPEDEVLLRQDEDNINNNKSDPNKNESYRHLFPLTPAKVPNNYGELNEQDQLKLKEITVHQNEKDDDFEEIPAKTRSYGTVITRFKGLGFAVLSCMAFPMGGLIAKYFKEYHAFSKCLWRFQGLLLPAIPIMLYLRFCQDKPIFNKISPVRENDNLKNVGFLLMRATTGFGAIFFQFYALQYITLADQMVIGSSVPVFVAVFAYWLLGEKFGYVQFLLCTVTMLGVCVVARPPFLTGAKEFDHEMLVGSALSLGSMFMAVLTIVFTRRMKKLPFILITFTYGLCSTIYSLAFAIPMGVLQFPQGQFHIILSILFAGLAFMSQTSMTLALKYEQAGPVSLVRTSNIAFAFLWQYIFLGVVPDRFSVIGALIIAIAVVLTTVRKWIGSLPDVHPIKKQLGFLLV